MQVRFPKTVPKQGPRNRFQARFQAGTRLAGTGSQASVPRKSLFQSKFSRSNWELWFTSKVLGKSSGQCFQKKVPKVPRNSFSSKVARKRFSSNVPTKRFASKTCLGTCSWEPVAGNLAWEPLPGNLAWERAWEPYL